MYVHLNEHFQLMSFSHYLFIVLIHIASRNRKTDGHCFLAPFWSAAIRKVAKLDGQQHHSMVKNYILPP